MRGRRNCRAFSLVELVLALGVVTFCLVALFGLLQSGLLEQRQSVDQTRAAYVAQAVLDDFRGAGRDGTNAVSTNTNSFRFGLPFPLPGQVAGEGSFILNEQMEITNAPAQNSYVVHYRVEPPTADEGVFKPSKVRLIIAWPGAAQFAGSGTNLTLPKAVGSIETTLEVSRG